MVNGSHFFANNYNAFEKASQEHGYIRGDVTINWHATNQTLNVSCCSSTNHLWVANTNEQKAKAFTLQADTILSQPSTKNAYEKISEHVYASEINFSYSKSQGYDDSIGGLPRDEQVS